MSAGSGLSAVNDIRYRPNYSQKTGNGKVRLGSETLPSLASSFFISLVGPSVLVGFFFSFLFSIKIFRYI